MNAIRSESWFSKRIMTLTGLERRLVNSSANAERTMRLARSLLERVELPQEPRCLEVGCGQGAVTRLLVEGYRARAIASDRDPAQVEVARERLADLGERVEFRVVDARTMPFDDAQFDLVVAFQVMHHIPGEWRKVVAETARVLRPGGRFVFTDLVLSPGIGRVMRRLLPRLDPLEETALQECLAENRLRLEYHEGGWQGLLDRATGHWAVIARRA